ncbi:MAG: ABC transporter ATP-binding protein/permease [Lachnospiraceae bacterium]|nr:ABC transporter ATP-binding protein/permease [Lachnospiraceae bacterium]
MTALQWFNTFLSKYKLKMLIGMILVTILSVAAFIAPKITGVIVDEVIKGENKSLLTKLIIILLVTVIIRGICRFMSQVLFEQSSQGVLYNMRDTVYRKLLQEDFAFYNKNRTGDLMSRQTGDMDAIRHFVAYVIYAVYENVLYFVFALVMIFITDYRLAFAMFLVLPISAINTWQQMKNVKPAFGRWREAFSRLNTFVQENISGNRVVKAFAKEEFERQKFDEVNDYYRDAELNASKIWRKYVPRFEVLSNVLTIVLMLVGGYMVIKGNMTIGNLVTINGYLWMLNMPLRMAGWWINDIQRFTASLDKIYATYTADPDINNLKHPIEKDKIRGEVEFKKVSYTADDEDILKNIDFHIEAGKTVGILGKTGAGKSTFINLICRFFDANEGEVLIDGVNVKELDMYKLRDNIGLAMQDVFLFSDSIKNNISYGCPGASLEEVKQAAIMADANHFINEMPEGYDTLIGERGVGLSGGQKQRISLARALIKDPAILILDDTTSAVDMETESYIQSQLAKVKGKCTTFIIAYRISSIMDADKIIVLDEGKIVEEGTHDELVKAGGYYASVYKHQK